MFFFFFVFLVVLMRVVLVLAELRSELDFVLSFNEIVPTPSFFDDFEKYGVEFCLICFFDIGKFFNFLTCISNPST